MPFLPRWLRVLPRTSAVFVAAPIPGNLFGARYVQRTCGGYENFSKTHAFTIKYSKWVEL